MPQRQRIQLLEIVGSSLSDLYALVNVDVGFEEWRAHILWGDGISWKTIYREDVDFATSCALMIDGSIAAARDDGALILLNANESRVVQTHQRSGFLLKPLSKSRILLAGPYISIYDRDTGIEEVLSTQRMDWSAISSDGELVYVAGANGRLGVVNGNSKRVTLAPSVTKTNLTAVCVCQSRGLVIGGWNGLVQLKKGDHWEDYSLPEQNPVTGLVVRDTDVLACAGGVFVLSKDSNEWRCEVPASEDIWNLSVIDGHILACHTYSGLVSLWEGNEWQTPFPPLSSW